MKRLVYVILASIVFQGWELAAIGAAVVPYLPAIAAGITGTATIAAARLTGRQNRDKTRSEEKQETIGKLKRGLFDVKRNFDLWVDPAAQPVEENVDNGSKVDQALTDVSGLWAEKSELFTRPETSEIFDGIVTQFRRHYGAVKGVMLVGKARSPNYDAVLGEARRFLECYETALEDDLNDCFFKETASAMAKVRKTVSENPVSRRLEQGKRYKSQKLLKARLEQFNLQSETGDAPVNQRELERSQPVEGRVE